MTVHCFTLAYNLDSEVEKVTKLLYELNSPDTFKHLIVDLDFPLETGDRIPESIKKAKHNNSQKLRFIANFYGSEYVKMQNIGVQQNWTQVCKYLNLQDEDIAIGCDPDEHPLRAGWVKAMGDIIKEGNFGMAALMMTDHIPVLLRSPYVEQWINGQRVYRTVPGALNWGLLGITGKFFKAIGEELTYPQDAPRYGYIEACLYPKFNEYGFGWCVIADYMVRHTDFELGDPGTSSLLREWKNQIIFNIHQYGQLSFDEWLKMRREGLI